MSFAVSVETSGAPARAETPPTPAKALEGFVRERLAAIRRQLGDVQVLGDTLATLEAMAPDEINKPALLEDLREGIARADRRYELRSALRAIARAIKPRTYLEIGTRRGWSLAQVACEAPEVRAYAIDLWIEAYGGVPNPGPEFVHGEVCRVAPGFTGRVTYIDGNSHDVLPALLHGAATPFEFADEPSLLRESEVRPPCFDLVTVDGDHTAAGAWWDLCDVMPQVALGGVVVFDDLLDTADEMDGAVATTVRARQPAPNDLRPSLLEVWHRLRREFPNFAYFENLAAKPPIGIACRVR